MSVETVIQVNCQNCSKEADYAYCDSHLDDLKSDSYQEGKAEGESVGYEKGYADAQAKFETV